ncbi:M48 family metallopeptidase [Candidatus Gracilibacteria bacterium]|nr:M48 family metallopeptidase [Candidatus Gracilibacteria bacterium]
MKYKLIRTWRKTLALQIKNGELIVRSPKMMPKFMIDNFVTKHKNWIENKMKVVYPQGKPEKKSDKDILELKKKARKYIPERVEYFAKKYNKKYNKIRITSARTRWGSCTSQKNLNFSYRLIQADSLAIDYVIIHELAHLKYMNHSKNFWNHVGEMMPDYKQWDNWLKKEGRKLG